MAQIIKQPNGKYCLFSTVVDSVTHYDCTPEEIIEIQKEKATSGIEEKVKGIIKKLEDGGKPYYQFTMNYDEMIETIKEGNSEEESKYVKSIIEK